MYYVLCVSGVSKLVSNNLTLVRYLNIKNVSLHLLKTKTKTKTSHSHYLTSVMNNREFYIISALFIHIGFWYKLAVVCCN